MNCYVINLPRSTERRAHIERQLEQARLEREYVEAVDGRELQGDDPRVDWAAVARHPDWLVPGMLGASLSHLAAYRRILQDGDPSGLVLEDDAVIPRDLDRLLGDLNLEGAEVALLYYRAFGECELGRPEAIGRGYRLLAPSKPEQLVCTAAYVITAEACRRMLAALEPVRLSPDVWGTFLEEGLLERVRCVHPMPVHVKTDFQSTLGYAPRTAKLVPARLRAWRRRRIERRMSRFAVS